MLEKKIIAVNEASLRRAKFKWKGLLAEKYNFFSFFPADGQRGHNSHSGQPMLPAEYCAEDPAAASAVAFYSAMEALDEALFANIPCELGFEKIKNYAIHLAALYSRMFLPEADAYLLKSDRKIDPAVNSICLADFLVRANIDFLASRNDIGGENKTNPLVNAEQLQHDYLGWIIYSTLVNAANESYSAFNKHIENYGIEIKNGRAASFEGYSSGDFQKHGSQKQAQSHQAPQSSALKKVSFNDIAGYDAVKDYFCKLAKSMKGELPDIYSKLGIPRPCGFLLYGPPGTGKNLLVYAFANEAGWPYHELNLDEAFDKFVGESEKKIAEFLRRKGVLFIDEFDSVGKKSTGFTQGYQLNITNVIASCMNQYDGERIIFAATNDAERISEKLKRGKRFGKVIELGYPKVEDTEAILRLKLSAASEKSGNNYLAVDCRRIAQRLHDIAGEASKEISSEAGFSGGDIEEVVNLTLEKKGMEMWQGNALSLPQEDDYIRTAERYDLSLRQM